MKTRNLVGGAVVGALIVGVWLGSFFKGFGLGGSGSSGNGLTAETLSNSRAEVRSYTETGASSPSASVGKPREEAGPDFGLPPQFVTVVILEDRYRLVTGDDPFQGKELPLDEVKRRAEDTVGTNDGIRVRILKEKSAQEGARSDLLQALSAVGIKREEIQERSDFLKAP